MEIQYIDKFDQYGCNWTGNLAVVDYSARADEIRAPQPLAGFGRGASIDALRDAEALMKSEHPEGFEVLLGIPKLVVRLKEGVADNA